MLPHKWRLIWPRTTTKTSSPRSFVETFPATRSLKTNCTLAFLDIMPRSPGHTLVIPKVPARGILDIPADDLAGVARTAQKISQAAVKAFDAEGIILQQFSEPASGQVIFHLHVHVIPVT